MKLLAVVAVGGVALAALPASAILVTAPTACAPAQLEVIASAAASAAGILAACERDTGFRLFPFSALPKSPDQQRHVCLGRSCPTAISSLQDAKLPECLVAASLTPAAFLDRVCKTSEPLSGMELSQDLIKRRSKHFDLACVTLLDLSAADIGHLAHLDKCVDVLEINLQNNALRSVNGFPSLASLRSLDVSNNKIASIDNLPACPAVEELSFAFPQLRSLQLQDNPVSARSDFVDLVRTALPNLLLLNGEAVALFNIGRPAANTRAANPPYPGVDLASARAVGSARTPTSRVDAVSGSPIPFSAQASHPSSSPPESSTVTKTHASFDTDKFVEQETRRIDELLQQCASTLEVETARVLKAFNVASVS